MPFGNKLLCKTFAITSISKKKLQIMIPGQGSVLQTPVSLASAFGRHGRPSKAGSGSVQDRLRSLRPPEQVALQGCQLLHWDHFPSTESIFNSISKVKMSMGIHFWPLQELRSILHIIQLILPGQSSMLQLWLIFNNPLQVFPPCPGEGLEHCLQSSWSPPPQETEQLEQVDQLDQPPSTRKSMPFCKFFHLDR